jgi:tyrosyl-tRNA synthetase
MTTKLGVDEKFALVKENLAEILNPELIERVYAEGRDPRIYWGTGNDSF